MDSDNRFSKRNLSYVAILMLVGLVSMGSTASGANTILELNGGQMDVNGNNIVDSGTTIWDASNGYVPKANIQNLVASDVGLGNVLNKEQLAVDGSNSMNGDLDLGSNNLNNINKINFSANVEIKNSSSDDLVLSANTDSSSINLELLSSSTGATYSLQGSEFSYSNTRFIDFDAAISDLGTTENDVQISSEDSIDFEVDGDSSSGGIYSWSISGSDGSMNANGLDISEAGADLSLITGASRSIGSTDGQNRDLEIESNDDMILTVGSVTGSTSECTINSDTGDFTCDGTKSWVHSLNSTHEAYYTSQESGDVRAVYEGETHVVESKKISLPDHFSKTVSDSEPMLRAQVTPRGTLTNSAAMKVTDNYIKIAVGKETDVDFRVTGIREGYEDKQVVREKE